MGSKMFAALMISAVAVGGGSASPARAQATQVFDCGSSKVTLWLWPKGSPKGWIPGYEKDSIPQAYAMNGWQSPVATRLAAATHAGIAGVEIGQNCVPTSNLKAPLRRPPLTRIAAATKVRCAFPSHPLIQILTLSNGHKRLNLVLSPAKLVASADVTLSGATLLYAKQYCTLSPSK